VLANNDGRLPMTSGVYHATAENWNVSLSIQRRGGSRFQALRCTSNLVPRAALKVERAEPIGAFVVVDQNRPRRCECLRDHGKGRLKEFVQAIRGAEYAHQIL